MDSNDHFVRQIVLCAMMFQLVLGIVGWSSNAVAAEDLSFQAVTLKQKGDAWLQAGEYTKASAAYERSLTLDPTNANTYFNLAIAYYQQKDCGRACEALEQLVRYQPRDAEAHYNIGCFKLYENAIPGALQHFEQAALHNDNDPFLTPRLVQATTFLDELGQADEAHRALYLYLLERGVHFSPTLS